MILDSPRPSDYVRQSLNLVLGSIMWLCSSLNLFFDSARSPADMSDTNDSLLVPFGAAFSIWLPIFVLCFIYAVLQALPRNRTEPVYRRLGWWTAAGFAGVCLWGIINAFAPMKPFDLAQWGTALIFVPTMLLLVKAMLIATAEKDKMTKFERNTVHLGLSLIAGWCSIAVFLNWTPQIVSGLEGFGIKEVWICGALALIIAFWAIYISEKSNGNGAYIFPIIWGASFTIFALFKENASEKIYFVTSPLAVLIASVFMTHFMKYTKPVSTRIFGKA